MEATTEQIEGWKQKYGQVFEIECEGTVAYYKTADRTTLQAFYANSKNLYMAVETLAKNCWIGGDESFKTDPKKIMSVGEYVEELTSPKKSTLKEL
jgi:hypothetical protein